MFFGRNDAKAETPGLWLPHAKGWLIGKDSDAGRDWGHKEKGTTEDEMAGWHHWLDGREFEWTLGVGDGQGGLACCDSRGRKGLDTTEWLKILSSSFSYIQLPVFMFFLIRALDKNYTLPRMCYIAIAKSLQSCPTLCDPIDGSPPGSSIHGIFQARMLEWGAIAFSENVLYMKIQF